MSYDWKRVVGWGIFEYCPTPPLPNQSPDASFSDKRLVIFLDTHEDAIKVLDTLQKTSINFEVYTVEGVTK